eukprot:TRINITY_DN3936_c0_g1_i10.p1 TRINITY_DN3936_c0_g1~~TRINITY_DN3936_c0_g1_i10.p1  ORF type:complete len:372 (+),score=30.24 TRINITY_DN3936_c0_g1_i10:189-1304(+)
MRHHCMVIQVKCASTSFTLVGESTPPRFGDYEAQRHWMEVTVNLPCKDWYRQTEQNDLQWWGLDYPPLTAYHSWLNGQISSWFEPKSVELGTSRGYETPSHRQFMRFSVLFSDVVIYFTAMWYYIKSVFKKDQVFVLFIFLLQPALILIDHGHFQYNCVSLGLVLWALGFLHNGNDLLGSFTFTLALNYKQMSLYFAPAFFFYLLGKNFWNFSWSEAFLRILRIGLVVLFSFVLCWLPFILDGPGSVLGVLYRIFPTQRGLYEDKVANFWCSLSPIIKFKELFPTTILVKLCASTTLLMMMPSCLFLFRWPTYKNFLITCSCCSLSFFLFSFHVHEKSILFPLLPITLMSYDYPTFGSWINIVASFSCAYK